MGDWSNDPHARNLRQNGRRAVARGDIERASEIASELYKPVEQWDWEELVKGWPRNVNGQFNSRPPVWLTAVVQREAERRMKKLAKSKLAGSLDLALSTMIELMESDDVDADGRAVVPASVKLRAAQFVWDNVVGKATQTVEIEAGETVMDFLADVITVDDGSDAHPVVIEGHLVESEDENGRGSTSE